MLHRYKDGGSELSRIGSAECSGFLVYGLGGQWKTHTVSIKIAQKPYIIGSAGPKALKYESFDARGYFACRVCCAFIPKPLYARFHCRRFPCRTNQ